MNQNKFIQFFTDYRERKVNLLSYFYGFFVGLILGIMFVFIFPNIFIITLGSFIFLAIARFIYLKMELKEEENQENDYEE